ncbi:MAG TPA: hypothetical protein VF881_04745 [Polyangiaceae bacterium]
MKAMHAAACVLIVGCSRPARASSVAGSAEAREVTYEGALALFRENSVDGAFVLFDARRSLTTVVLLVREGALPPEMASK